MPHIELNTNLPGVTGLLEYRKDTAEPLRELTNILLRGDSTLTEAERELIATVVSHRNDCTYCTTAHAEAANAYLHDADIIHAVRLDIQSAPLSPKMKSLLTLASEVQAGGKHVKPSTIDEAKQFGASDREIHDTVMIAALFCFYNRYVDGLATDAPEDMKYYKDMALRLKDKGYYRPDKGYDGI